MDDASQKLIDKTNRLNQEYKKLLEICEENPSEENLNDFYKAHQAWVEALNELKKHNIFLLLDIRDQY